MKTKFITFLAAFAVSSIAFAQSPSPAPAPASTPVIQIPADQQAAAAPILVANQIAQQINGTVSRIQQILANGIPARPAVGNQPAQPAISADAIKAALGPVNLAKIQAAVAALSATPSPTPSP